jgi:hypothetical protein
MKKTMALALSFAALCPIAHATLTPLPGVQGQTARVLSALPAPIRFHVTDASGKTVGGAIVDVTVASGPTSPNPQLPAFGGINPPPYATRFFSNQDGDTDTNDRYYGRIAGTYVLHAVSDYGTVDVTVNVVEGARPARMEIVGGQQTISGNTVAPQPFSVRVFDTDGQPFPRPLVGFFQFLDQTKLYTASGNFETVIGDSQNDIGSVSDADGYASSGTPFFTLPYPGNGVVTASVFQGFETNKFLNTDIPFTVIAPPAGVPTSYQDMWWGGDSQNGWGVSVIEHDRRMFVVVFAYDSTGKPAWYVVPDATWQLAEGFQLKGTLYQPTASPYTAFDTNSVTVGPALGTMLMLFTSSNDATLHLGGGKPGSPPPMAKSIQRMTFGDPSAVNRGVSDMWWGGASQSGWGISVIEHTGTFFSVWYTYGADRKSTWFVMPGGGWDPTGNYVGQVFTTTNPSWATAYDASKLVVTTAGTYTLHVDDPSKAMRFDYLINGVGGTLPLSREPF